MDLNLRIKKILREYNTKSNTSRKLILEDDSEIIKKFPACVANEVDNPRRGKLIKTPSGQIYINVYVMGLDGFHFYSNGRVQYPNGGKMGNYYCEGSQPIIDGHRTWSENFTNGKWENETATYVTDYERRELKKIETFSNNLDPHSLLTITQIGTAFIPLIGPLISAGVGLADAYLYYKEGDTKTAGLVGLFSCIPVAGQLANKIGLTKWSAKALGEIGKKLSLGTKLTEAEVQVVNKVAQNRQLITREIEKLGEQASINTAKQSVKKQLAVAGAKQTAKNTAKTITGYGAAGYGYNKGYNYVQGDTPKVKAETGGQDWDNVKLAFGSSGNVEDNTLLSQAWDKGWRPGQVVPKEFQTQSYKQNYTEDSENLDKLQQLISQNQ